MATVNLDELENAMIMVTDSEAGAEAWVCRTTGKIYVRSDYVDPEEEQIPEDIDEDDKYVPIPTSRDLDLGRDLVFRFVQAQMPQQMDRVYDIFGRKGAYGRFHQLLHSLGMRSMASVQR
jgi:hypothetical protein